MSSGLNAMPADGSIELIAVPFSDGAPNAGARLGPHALLASGLLEALDLDEAALRWVDVELHDGQADLARSLLPRGRARNTGRVADLVARLSSVAEAATMTNTTTIFLGGDHSISMGSITGVARRCAREGRELFVLWIDAHGDFNTPEITPTGNMHGMALAMLCGEPVLPAGPDMSPRQCVRPENVLMLGTRSLDACEAALMRRRGLQIVGMARIAEFGLRLPLQRFLDRVRLARGVLHVSFDVDALDPSVAPGVGTPVRCGLEEGQACVIFDLLRQSGLVSSLDVVELDPSQDVDRRSARFVVRMIANLLRSDLTKHDPIREEMCHDRTST